MQLEKFTKFQKTKTVEVAVHKTAWGYTRVSSKDQFQNYSLDEQKRDMETFLPTNGFELVQMLGGTYESASGDFTRKEFSKLIDEVRKAKQKPYSIAIRTINRFSRSGGGAIAIVNELVEKLGVHLIETSTGLCTDNEYDKLEIYRKLLEAKKENLERLKITIPGMKALLTRGGWLGKPPRGYTLKGKKVTDTSRIQAHQEIFINDEGKHLMKAWQWKLAGERDFVIRKRLETLGVKMAKQAMSEMWKKPFYCGVSVNALLESPQKGNWKPMVTEAEFWKVQTIIDENKPAAQKKYSKSKISAERPLTGFVKCTCGSPLTSYEVKVKGLHYYKCQRCADASYNANSTKKSNGFGLNDLFKELLGQYTLKPELVAPFTKQLEKIFQHLNREGYDEVESLSEQLKSISIKLKRLNDKYISNPEFGDEQYNQMKREFDNEMQEKSNQLETARQKISNHGKHIGTVTEISENMSKRWAFGDIETKLRIQKLVFPDGVSINPKKRQYLTKKVNRVFELTSIISRDDESTESKKPTDNVDGSCLVAGTGLEPVTFGL